MRSVKLSHIIHSLTCLSGLGLGIENAGLEPVPVNTFVLDLLPISRSLLVLLRYFSSSHAKVELCLWMIATRGLGPDVWYGS